MIKNNNNHLSLPLLLPSAAASSSSSSSSAAAAAADSSNSELTVRRPTTAAAFLGRQMSRIRRAGRGSWRLPPAGRPPPGRGPRTWPGRKCCQWSPAAVAPSPQPADNDDDESQTQRRTAQLLPDRRSLAPSQPLASPRAAASLQLPRRLRSSPSTSARHALELVANQSATASTNRLVAAHSFGLDSLALHPQRPADGTDATASPLEHFIGGRRKWQLREPLTLRAAVEICATSGANEPTSSQRAARRSYRSGPLSQD